MSTRKAQIAAERLPYIFFSNFFKNFDYSPFVILAVRSQQHDYQTLMRFENSMTVFEALQQVNIAFFWKSISLMFEKVKKGLLRVGKFDKSDKTE